MAISKNIYLFITFFLLVHSLFFVPTLAHFREDKIRCLQGLKNRLTDPQLSLHTWDFSNNVCNFMGVTCGGNRLEGLQLPSIQLEGEIPDSLQYCRSLKTLDLSQNSLSGRIPLQICEWLPYLETLSLYGNKFSGHIPWNLVGCKELVVLNLGRNRLSGGIPYQLSRLNHLKSFSVSNNKLYGQIPSSLSRFPTSSFSGNFGLCGPPLSYSRDENKINLTLVVAAGYLGAWFTVLFWFVMCRRCFVRHFRMEDEIL